MLKRNTQQEILSETKRIKRLEWGVVIFLIGIIFSAGIFYGDFASAKGDIAELKEQQEIDRKDLHDMRIILERVDTNVKFLRGNRDAN